MTAQVSGPDREAVGRAARREPRLRRRRRLVALGTALGVAVAGAVAGLTVWSGGGGTTQVAPPTVAITTPTSAAPSSTGAPPPAVTATTKVPTLQVFDAPNGAPITTLSDRTDYLQPRTLLVTQRQPGWVQALLPIRPNGTTGWVRESDVTLSTTPYLITIDLAQHHLWLTKDGQPVLDSAVVIGKKSTPTPVGTFYVTDPVDLRSNPNTTYGAYAIGLSGYSEVLYEFNGGPGQIAIHGTPNPEQVGQDLSNGCVRVPNDVILRIAELVPLGTPVRIF